MVIFLWGMEVVFFCRLVWKSTRLSPRILQVQVLDLLVMTVQLPYFHFAESDFTHFKMVGGCLET
jgi:hypothetical protein